MAYSFPPPLLGPVYRLHLPIQHLSRSIRRRFPTFLHQVLQLSCNTLGFGTVGGGKENQMMSSLGRMVLPSSRKKRKKTRSGDKRKWVSHMSHIPLGRLHQQNMDTWTGVGWYPSFKLIYGWVLDLSGEERSQYRPRVNRLGEMFHGSFTLEASILPNSPA